MEQKKFFRLADWVAFGLTFLITLIVYTLTLAPTVTLEDSGELITASDYLGVPHPPGYPIWSLITWFFQWIFNWVTYHGHPNPAWGVGFCSAFAGALACGVLALLVSRSGADLIRSLKKETDVLGEKTESLFSSVAGISSGLLLAFSQGLWSQSVIAEVYALNILFQTLVLLLLYRWMIDQENPKPLFLMAFVFGLGLTNHQTLLFMGLAVALAVFLRHIRLARDFAAVGLFYVFMVAANKFGPPEWGWIQGPESFAFWFWTVYVVVVPVLGLSLPNGKTVCATYLLMLLGLSFYLYMPISSDQNPPINWGYPRTWEGLMHAITRGQYEKVTLTDVFSRQFLEQIGAFLRDLRAQFLGPIALLAVLPFAFIARIGRKNRDWLFTTVAAFIGVGIIFIILQDPKLDIQTLFIARVQYIQSHAVYALWIGYGLLLLMVWLEAMIKRGLLPLCYKRRLSRFAYFSWACLYSIVCGLVSGVVSASVDKTAAVILCCCISLFGTWLISFPVVQRLHDIGRSGRCYWLLWIPIYGIYWSLVLLFRKGTSGDNQYGADQLTEANSICFERWIQKTPVIQVFGIILVLLLPFSLIYKNYYSEDQLKVVGGSEQNGHDFGWQFGNWQLRGAEGIKEDIWYYCGKDQKKFDAEWAKYPNPAYPPPMGTNAIFFGGTDPGRFVPTYMIYCPQVRADVYLITQNALADNTYMNVMRDLYGDQIWIPSQQDSNRAFQEYVQAIQSGKIDPGADVKMDGGRVQVQGVGGVMQINGILCKQIFDHNQYVTEPKTDEATRQSGAAVVPNDPTGPDGKLRKRDFFVEESYIIPWMYPYLTPHGLIMKINNEPTAITPEMIKNDHDFWDWYTTRLLGDQKFLRDVVARKTFSKLRSALAGLYAARGNSSEAEYGFKQAVALYPLSPEAVFRLADLYMRGRRLDDAHKVISDFAAQDVYNDSAQGFRKQIEQTQQMTKRKAELETLLRNSQSADISAAFELIQLYNALQEQGPLLQILNDTLRANLPPEIHLQLAQMLIQMKRFDLTEPVLIKYMAARPDDLRIQVDLAAVRVALGRTEPALDALKVAVEKGGEPIRSVLRKDARFQPLWNDARFQALVPPTPVAGRRLPLDIAPQAPSNSGFAF